MSALGKAAFTYSRLSIFRRLNTPVSSLNYTGIGNQPVVLRHLATDSSDGNENNSSGKVSEDVDVPPLDDRGAWKNLTDVYFWDKSKPMRNPVPIFDVEKVGQILKEMEINCETKDNGPDAGMPNPYTEPYKKCILCERNLHIDYKNTKLLSQFVSSHTGRIYGRAVTGLCIPMQKHISKLINRARVLGFMPYYNKIPEHLRDPLLFDTIRVKKSMRQDSQGARKTGPPKP